MLRGYSYAEIAPSFGKCYGGAPTAPGHRDGMNTMRPPDRLKSKSYFYWGSADSLEELREETESVHEDSEETRVLTLGGRYYIYYVPNADYWQRHGYSCPPEHIPPSLCHALPV